ncbi:quinone oxidoreductase [Penicillium lagena]|uniref:quinone oxidoreductase n=1 Tax=Penicillium lagena TaxID=94218 RepID=UPI002541FD1B|nr:quinone oxidoreductase [Penicillium lagena]KAJ5621164.1 quinone oxidoreductase [Penicillium lagena]
MKEVVVSPTRPLITAHVHEVPVPKPTDDQILIRVVVAASNPKDYKHVISTGLSGNSGDDAAGFVEDLGSSVRSSGQFRRGDRVAAFHVMMTSGGTYAEYALAPATTVFHIPDWISFESASTIPLTALAAALPLFRRQNLPAPWMKRSSDAGPLPLIVYGASSALGTFAIKLARLSNIHPIIAIAGGSFHYVDKFLDASKGDALVDHRNGTQAMQSGVKMALKGLEAFHALDAICEKKSWVAVSQMMSGGVLSVVQASEKYDQSEIPSHVQISYSFVGSAHSGAFLDSMPRQPTDKESVKADVDFSYVFFRYISWLLSKGEFEGHPYEVIPGGLDGVELGLRKLERGEAKGVKYVYRVLENYDVVNKEST